MDTKKIKRIIAREALDKTTGIILAVSIFATLLGCATGPKLECSIQPVKPQFKSAEPILISVVIRNRSNAPVNVAFWGLQKDRPIINFRVVDSSNNSSLLSTKKILWCGTGVENMPIPPGREYRVSVDLSQIWEWGGMTHMFRPGSYTVSAELFSQTAQGSRPKVAESGAATFEIIADQ